MAKTATMKVWDVDLGLAIHIEAPNGKYIVIDLGSKPGVSPLSSLRFKSVGYMVITHPHHDHFSDISNIHYGYPSVLWRVKYYTREELLEGARDAEKEDFVKYCDFSESFIGTLREEARPSSGIPFDGLTADVFATSLCDKSNKNNFSAIVVLKLGNAKVVVCGDNEGASFDILMKQDSFKEAVKDAYVLVAAHHGRESGYYDDFVKLVNPYITIISDTTKGTTSVTEKYTAKSRGYSVHNNSTGENSTRYCLTTRNDGNVKVIFGESDKPNHSGILSVYSNCSF